MGVQDWSTTADANQEVDSTFIGEGMSASGVNNAMRSIMAGVAELRDGVSVAAGIMDVDDYGPFTGRAAHDGEAAGYVYLSTDGDGALIEYAVLFVMGGGGSGDWGDPIPFQGPPGVGADGDPGSSDVVGTSTTSLAIATGAKAFTVVETDRGWGVGARLRASSDATPTTHWMEGVVASYSGTALTITVDLVLGSGSRADWTFNLTGEPGAAGDDGAPGAPGADGDITAANSPNAGEFARFTSATAIEGLTEAEFKAAANLEIGTDVQAYDADLTTWAGLTPSANHQTLVTQTFAQMRASLDLEAGTDFYSIAAANLAFQPLDADLTSWAGVTRAAGFDTFAATPSSANLRTLLSDETGTGIAYFVGGALGTPSSATLTNATGLPVAGLSDASANGRSLISAADYAAMSALLEASMEAAIDTLANLTSIQGVSFTFGSYSATLLNTTSEATFKAAVNLEANTDFYAPGGTDVALADGGTGSSTAAGARTNLELVGQQTIWLPAGAMTARTTNGAASGSLETGTNDVMAKYLAFDSTTSEGAQFAVQMPKSWNESTVVVQFVWMHPATTTNFGVRWGIRAVAFADDDALDTAFGTEQEATDTGGTTSDVYISPETGAMTVAGSPAAEELVVFEVYRDPADGADTMAVDAYLLGVKIHYTTDAARDD